MSKNDAKVWKTKYGKRRVRQEAPTLAEAIEVGRALSDELNAQAEIAASLMGVAPDTVLAELKKLPPPRANTNTVAFISRDGAQRAVIVERKPSRRIVTAGRPAVVRTLGSAR